MSGEARLSINDCLLLIIDYQLFDMQSSIKFLGFILLAGCSLFGNAELEPMEISALRLETETKNLPANENSGH